MKCNHTRARYLHPEGENDIYHCLECEHQVIYCSDGRILARSASGALLNDVERLGAGNAALNADLVLRMAQRLAEKQAIITVASLRRAVGTSKIRLEEVAAHCQQLVGMGRLVEVGRTHLGTSQYAIKERRHV